MAWWHRDAPEGTSPEDVDSAMHVGRPVPSLETAQALDSRSKGTAADVGKNGEREDSDGAVTFELPLKGVLASGSLEHPVVQRRKTPLDLYKGVDIGSNYDLGVKFSYMQIVSTDEGPDAWEPASAELIRILTDSAQARIRDTRSLHPHLRCAGVLRVLIDLFCSLVF